MNYSKYADKVYKKLSQYGGDCLITRQGSGNYNPETDEYDDEQIEIKGKCLVSFYDAKNIDGTNIKSGDIKVMASLSAAPKTGDAIKIESEIFTVINWSALKPNGNLAVYYTIQAR